jgi:hypothetical protein
MKPLHILIVNWIRWKVQKGCTWDIHSADLQEVDHDKPLITYSNIDSITSNYTIESMPTKHWVAILIFYFYTLYLQVLKGRNYELIWCET